MAKLGIVLAKTLYHVGRDSDAILPNRNAAKHAQKVPQNLEPLTGIEPVTSSLPRTRSTN
jgi:hypothetical protein